MDKTAPAHEGTTPTEPHTRNEGIIPRTDLPQALILTSELIRTGWTHAQIEHLLGDPFFSTPADSCHSHTRALLAELTGKVSLRGGGGFSLRQRFGLNQGGVATHPRHPYAVFVQTTPIGQSGSWLAVTRSENLKAGDILFCVTRQGAHLSKVAEVRASWRGFSIAKMAREREAEVPQ